MSELTHTPAAATSVTDAQTAYLEALTEEARIDRALEKARADLANLEWTRNHYTGVIRARRAELHTALTAELEADELAEAIDAAEALAEAEATA